MRGSDSRRSLGVASSINSALLTFFSELGEERTAALEVISLDMSAAYQKAIQDAAPQAKIVFDRFHVARLANDAADAVRRDELHQLPPSQRPTLERTRWAILKRPANLEHSEKSKLSAIQRANQRLYRAYLLKESFLDIFTALTIREAIPRLHDWLAWASRSKLKPFVKLARTVRTHRAGILQFFEHRLTNARREGMNNNIRLLSHRSYGLHSAAALISLIFLCYGGLQLPQLEENLVFSIGHALRRTAASRSACRVVPRRRAPGLRCYLVNLKFAVFSVPSVNFKLSARPLAAHVLIGLPDVGVRIGCRVVGEAAAADVDGLAHRVLARQCHHAIDV